MAEEARKAEKAESDVLFANTTKYIAYHQVGSRQVRVEPGCSVVKDGKGYKVVKS